MGGGGGARGPATLTGVVLGPRPGCLSPYSPDPDPDAAPEREPRAPVWPFLGTQVMEPEHPRSEPAGKMPWGGSTTGGGAGGERGEEVPAGLTQIGRHLIEQDLLR